MWARANIFGLFGTSAKVSHTTSHFKIYVPLLWKEWAHVVVMPHLRGDIRDQNGVYTIADLIMEFPCTGVFDYIQVAYNLDFCVCLTRKENIDRSELIAMTSDPLVLTQLQCSSPPVPTKYWCSSPVSSGQVLSCRSKGLLSSIMNNEATFLV